MQFVYRYRRDKLDIMSVLEVCAANISMLPDRACFHGLWLAYLWLRHRHDGTKDEWMTREDIYCERYYADPEIEQTLASYLDICLDQAAGAFANDLLDEDGNTPEFYATCERLKRAVADRIWRTERRWARFIPKGRAWVDRTARERAVELTDRLWEFHPTIDLDAWAEEMERRRKRRKQG